MPQDPDPFFGFTPDHFARRRARVLDRLDGSAMLLPAAPVQYSSRDTEHRYRPDSELFYVSGVTDSMTVALLRDQEEDDRFVLFVQARDPGSERWSGPRIGPDEAREIYGADAVHPLDELEERLPELLKTTRSVHYRLGARGGVRERVRSLVLEALDRARLRGSRRGDGPRRVVDPGEVLDDLRLTKDPKELERIREAASITVEAFREGLGVVAPGRMEWEIEAALEGSWRRRGARGPGFPTIVGAGENACVLHYVRNTGRLEDGGLLLVDGGADVGLYHGDVTRTVPVSGAFTAEQRAVYEVVEAARAAAVDAIRPGATVAEVHGAAVDVLLDGMLELELLEGIREEIREAEGHKAFFPHHTSHWLGLDVHDPGDYARDDESRPLEPGMVLTIEPGLYIPSEASADGPPAGSRPAAPASDDSEAPDRFIGPGAARFAGTGIRIEDDVVVTENGRENLTRALPTDPDEIAALVNAS